MKRLLCLTVALCLLVTAALAQPATEAAPLTGTRYYPNGSTADTATYAFSFACPQFTGGGETEKAINTYFSSMAADLANATPPDAVTDGQVPEAGAPAYYTHLDYRIARNDDDYLSVLLTSRQFLGNSETESWTAAVFALSGVYAGQPLSLTQVMGLEQGDGDAQSGISYASSLVYGLVWQIIQEQISMGQTDYDPDLTMEELQNAFSPESDFYLDEDGNLVFYIQAGVIAGEVNGILTYPFSPAELLSAVTP